MVRGHASVDGAAGNHTAYRSRCGAEQSVPDEAVPDYCTSHPASDLTGRRRRAAADLMRVGSPAIIMVPMPGTGLGRHGNGSHRRGRKRRSANEF
jgi:hypothetical protein